MNAPPGRPITVLNGVWVLVFLFEATFKGDDRGHQIGALALGILFTTLLVTEFRSNRPEPGVFVDSEPLGYAEAELR